MEPVAGAAVAAVLVGFLLLFFVVYSSMHDCGKRSAGRRCAREMTRCKRSYSVHGRLLKGGQRGMVDRLFCRPRQGIPRSDFHGMICC